MGLDFRAKQRSLVAHSVPPAPIGQPNSPPNSVQTMIVWTKKFEKWAGSIFLSKKRRRAKSRLPTINQSILQSKERAKIGYYEKNLLHFSTKKTTKNPALGQKQ